MLQAEISDTGKNRYTVIVDDGAQTSLGASDGNWTLQLARGLVDAEHTVRVIENSGVLGGIVQFHRFVTSSDGKFLQARPRPHRIEVIGDSLSTGAGDEGQQPSDRITMHNTNAALAYGSIAAEKLQADYTCVAVFGKQMAQRNTLPDIYERSLPSDEKSQWDFTQHVPDVAVVNLSTNDFYTAAFNADMFAKAYVTFLLRVREHYRDAVIYITDSPLLTDNQPSDENNRNRLRHLLDGIAATAKCAGVDNIHVFYFDAIARADGLGAGWHPKLVTHEKMGAKLASTIRTDLHWDETDGAQKTAATTSTQSQ